MSRLLWTIAVSLGYLLSAVTLQAAGQGEEPWDPPPRAAERKESAQESAQPKKVSVALRRSIAADNETPTFRGQSVNTWIADLKDQDVAVRREAATALAQSIDKAGPSDQASKALLPVLFDTLKDTDTAVRRQAALGWVRFNRNRRPQEQEAQVLLPVLLDALHDSAWSVRQQAGFSLVIVNRDPKVVLAPLTKLLKDSDQRVRASAAGALGAVDPGAAAVPVLIGALDDESADVRTPAAGSLGRLGEPAKVAVPRLIAALKDSAPQVRSSAADALGAIRSEAKAIVPALIHALKGPREPVAWALHSNTPRASAAWALGRLGSAAKTAVPDLVRILNDEDEYDFVRKSALKSLVEIDPEGEKTQASLIAALKDKKAEVQSTAAQLCAGLGPKAKAAVPTLIALLTDDKDDEDGYVGYVRFCAGQALKKIDHEAAKKAGVQ